MNIYIGSDNPSGNPNGLPNNSILTEINGLRLHQKTSSWTCFLAPSAAEMQSQQVDNSLLPPHIVYSPQVKEVVKPPQPTPSTVVARPVRKAPPTAIHDMRRHPEIIPVQEAIPEESAEDESSAPPSERGGCTASVGSEWEHTVQN